MTVLCIEFHEDGQWLGGSIYIENLLAALSALPVAERPDVRIKFLSSLRTPLARRLLDFPVVANRPLSIVLADLAAKVRRIHRALVRRWKWVGSLSRSRSGSIYFPAFDTLQIWRDNLYWIPDFQPLHLPELFDAAELQARTQGIGRVAEADGLLLLSSRAALSDFERFCPTASIRPRVWSFCSSVEAGSLEACRETVGHFGLPEKFLYVANHFWKHKDHETAFQALKLLKDRGIEVPLVCTGLQADRRDPTYYSSLMRKIAAWDLEGQVHSLGVIPRAHQIELFRAAAAVVQPSRFEGWSTVVEDAKALGRPIIASDIAVHAEQIDGLRECHLFRTADAAALAGKIAELWEGLSAGPFPDIERAARERRNGIRVDIARQFLAIVEEASAFSRPI